MSSKIELIVFDWDGTLMDSSARIVESLREAARALGLAEHDDVHLRDVIGLGMREAILKLHPELDDGELVRFTDAYRHQFLVACPHPTPLFDGVLEMLGALEQRRLWLGVATGKSRRGLDRALKDTELGRYFHVTRTAEETCSKPDPEMLHEIMDELGVHPENTLMVGDTEYDLDMAQRAGVASIAVTYGAHEHHRLPAYNPLVCLHSVKELHRWFQSNLD